MAPGGPMLALCAGLAGLVGVARAGCTVPKGFSGTFNCDMLAKCGSKCDYNGKCVVVTDTKGHVTDIQSDFFTGSRYSNKVTGFECPYLKSVGGAGPGGAWGKNGGSLGINQHDATFANFRSLAYVGNSIMVSTNPKMKSLILGLDTMPGDYKYARPGMGETNRGMTLLKNAPGFTVANCGKLPMPAPAGNGNSPPDNINVFIVVPCPPVVVPAPPPPPAPPVICTRPPFRALLIPSVDWSNAHEISLAQSTLNITGLACAKGYTGKPKPMCTKAAGTYSVSGCTKVSTYKKVQPTYKLMPAADGRCNDDASLISSFDDCQAALNAIKKKRNDVRNTVPAVLRNVPLLPRGCFFKPLSGYVFWNAQGSAGGGSYNVPHQAICKTASTCKVTVVPPPFASAGTCKLGSTLLHGETCTLECAKGMTPLGSQPQCTGSGAGQVTSKFRCAHIGTCADILRRSQGTAKDGSYLIDPDGHGPVPAFNVQCDMINGGYMLVLYRVEGHKSLATDYVTDQSGGSHLRDDLWASIKPKYGKVLTKFSGSRLIGTQPEQMLLSDIETLQGARCVPWAKATNLGAAPLVKDAAACTGAAQASFMFGGTAGQPSTFFSGLGAPLYAGTDGRKRYNGTDAGARAWTVAEMWVMATPPPPPGTAAPPPPPIWAPLDQWAQQSNTMGHVGIGIRATTTKLVVEYKDVQLADQPYGNMLLDNRDSKADTQSAEWLRRGHTTPGTFAIFVDQNKGTSVAAQKMSLGVLVRTPKGNNLVLRGAKQIFDAPLSTKLMVLTIEFTPRDTTVTLFVEGRGTDSVIVPMSTTNGNSNVLDPRRSRLDTFYVGHQRFGSPVLHLNAQARVTYSTVPNIGAAAPPSPPAPLRPEWKLTPKGGLTCSSVQLTAKAQIRYERAGVPSGNKDRTVSVWFKPDCSKSGISNVLSWGHSRNPRQRFSIMYGRNCQTSGFAGQNMDWWGMPGPKKGAWTLHTYVYAAGQMRLYINGGSVVGGSSHGPKGLNLNTAPMDGKHPLVLGGNAFPRTDEPFGGSIFRVRIWDRALSAAEVADDFNMKTGAITKGLVVNIRHDNAGSIIDTLRAPTGMGVIKVGATSSINDAPPGCATIVVGPSPAPPPLGPSTTPTFAQMTKGGYKDGETGSQDWGNTGNCAGGDWSDKGTYWYQGPCNGGASWLTANGLAGSTDDYEFTVSIWNEDDDDSGVVWRYTDKQNYVRFHHTLNNAYNSGRKPALSGCQGLGSFVVVRKAGKETCLKTHNWKFTKGKWHTYRIISLASGDTKIYVDGSLVLAFIPPTSLVLSKGSVGVWQAHSQIRVQKFSYAVAASGVAPPPPPSTATVSATPKFSQMTKGGYKDGETGSQDWGNTGNCAGGDWSDKGTYWYQGPCNGGASWLTANGLAGSTDDYEFTVSIWNEDDDDSGVVWRYTDKQNYVRFHHTLNNAYNSGRKPALSGCQGLGSFVVVRKAGKETCLKTHNWKYTKGKWHTYKVVSSAKPGGAAKIYVDGALIADVKTGLTKGTVGIWQAHSQLRIKGFKYSVQKPVPPPPPPIAKPPVAPPPAPPTVGACKADTNSDGFTTMTDVLAVLGAEGMNDCTLQSDVSGDCLVTAKDLLMVLMEITEGCGCSNRGAGKPKLTSKGTFTCSCASGWGGAHCEKKKLSWAKPVVSTGAPGKVTTLSGETFYDGGPRPVCSVTFCRGLACRGRCHLKQEPIPWKTPAGCRSGVGCSACKPAQYSFWTGIGVSGKDRFAYGYCSKAQWIDGPAKQARYSTSRGIKVSPDGTYVVVADTENHVIRKTDMRTGDVTTIAGGGDGKMKPGSGWLRGNPGYAEGAGACTKMLGVTTGRCTIGAAMLERPSNPFFIDGGKTLMFSESGPPGGARVRTMDIATGQTRTIVGGPPLPTCKYDRTKRNYVGCRREGVGKAARIGEIPTNRGMELSPDGTFLLIADRLNDEIFRMDMKTLQVTSILGKAGSRVGWPSPWKDGTGDAARLFYPEGLSINPANLDEAIMIGPKWASAIKMITGLKSGGKATMKSFTTASWPWANNATYAVGAKFTPDGKSLLVWDQYGSKWYRHKNPLYTRSTYGVPTNPSFFGTYDLATKKFTKLAGNKACQKVNPKSVKECSADGSGSSAVINGILAVDIVADPKGAYVLFTTSNTNIVRKMLL